MSKLFLKIFLLKNRLMIKLRVFYWRNLFLEFGKNSKVFGRIVVYSPDRVKIGENTSLNEGVILNARGGIEIGSNVHISSAVVINSGSLDYMKTQDERIHTNSPVKIKNGAWITTGVLVNQGVTIGENSVVGAGSVVTKNIPDNEVWVGVPAKFLKKL